MLMMQFLLKRMVTDRSGESIISENIKNDPADTSRKIGHKHWSTADWSRVLKRYWRLEISYSYKTYKNLTNQTISINQHPQWFNHGLSNNASYKTNHRLVQQCLDSQALSGHDQLVINQPPSSISRSKKLTGQESPGSWLHRSQWCAAGPSCRVSKDVSCSALPDQATGTWINQNDWLFWSQRHLIKVWAICQGTRMRNFFTMQVVIG